MNEFFSLNCCIHKVKSLELQCHNGDEKMQKCRQKIEKVWSVAREEEEKCKAAKEVIKALALRVRYFFHFVLDRLSNIGLAIHIRYLIEEPLYVVVTASYDVGEGNRSSRCKR